jgi:cytochrome c oxidase assembly protein subunit 15
LFHVKHFQSPAISPWPRRVSAALAALTFPLVWIGGLVTTTDAGMAVPDWPNTFGYNLFQYPWSEWFFGPWDLFIEHGHRLFASLVGLVTIALAIIFWRCEPRRWMRVAGLVALVAVIAQGVLGGLRVVLDERTLAMIHGCSGPAFFALTVALVVFTSPTWREAESSAVHPLARSLHRLTIATASIAYLQLVLGAVLRHLPVWAAPDLFRTVVFSIYFWRPCWRGTRSPFRSKSPAGILAVRPSRGWR